MRLRNKKTGEVVEPVGISCINGRYFIRFEDERGVFKYECRSLAQLNEEWEDYEEPKECEYWYIEADGQILQCHKPKFINHLLDKQKAISNYFETKEEAEKAVEKLKAYKRLKEKGFRFFNNKTIGEYGNVSYRLNYPATTVEEKDLDLLFSEVKNNGK